MITHVVTFRQKSFLFFNHHPRFPFFRVLCVKLEAKENYSWTTAEQEVLALIAPLGKLGRLEEALIFFQANA